jgi:uncharacterized protein (DUF58 family)
VTAAELARKVRLVELRARRRSGSAMSGAWHSAFKGRGVEFHEVRDYVPGDDVRAIDWKVTARAGRPYIKRFTEEREQTLMLLVDASRSLLAAKRDLACELCALLAFAAVNNRDAAGMLLFTDEVEMYLPPGRGIAHVLRLIREVLAFTPWHPGTRIGPALEFLARVQRRRSLAFLVSDFQDHGWEKALRVAGRRHELIALPIHDARERRLPHSGLVALRDPETGVPFTLDTADPAVRQAWEAAAGERSSRLRSLFGSAGIDHLAIEAGSDYAHDLAQFLHRRARRD